VDDLFFNLINYQQQQLFDGLVNQQARNLLAGWRCHFI